MKNSVQLTSWEALRAGIVSTTKAMLKWLVTNPAGWAILATTAITGLVKGYDALIGRQEKLARTNIEDLDEDISKYDEEIQSLEELQSKLESAKGNKSELAQIQNELNDAIGETTGLLNGEGKAYDIANAKLKANIELKKQQRAQAQKDKIKEKKNLFDDNVYEDGSSWFNTNADSMRWYAQKYQELVKEYENALDDSDIKKMYGSAEDYAFGWLNVNASAGIKESTWADYWDEQVQTAYDIFEDTIEDYDGVGGQDFIKNIINNMVRGGSDLSQISDVIFDIINNQDLQDKINEYWASLVDPEIDSEKALNAVKTMIDGIIKQYPQLEAFFTDFYDGIVSGANIVADTVTETANKIDVSNVFELEKTNLGKLSESIDKIQDAYKALYSAIEEYNSEGAISIDTLQSVIALGDDWLDYLVDEQGNLKLDQEALQNLTASRLNDMRVQAINNVIDNVSKINDEVSAKDYLASTNYALAESYEELAEKKLEDLQLSLTLKGLDAGTIDGVIGKATADISKINKLFDNTNISPSSIMGNSKSSASEKKWKDYLDKLLSSYEAELELGLIDFENFTDKSFDILEKFYREGKITAEEYWDSINKLYEKQLDIYNRVLSVVEDVYDVEIQKLKKEKDLLQDKIDSLNDEADAYELVRKKEEALYALEQSQRNRSKKIYVGGKGYIYDQDHEAIRKAQDNLNNIKTEEVIASLKKEQDAIDKSIEVLEEYKKKWSEISDVYKKEQNKQLAVAILGENYEKTILRNRISDIDNFKNLYVGIQQDIAKSALESAEAQVEAANKSSEALQKVLNNKKTVDNIDWSKVYGNPKIAYNKYRVVRKGDGKTVSDGYTDPAEAYRYIFEREKYSTIKGMSFEVEAYSKGGVVGSKKSSLDTIAQQVGEDRVITVKEGERVLTPVQNEMWEKWTKALPGLENLAKTMNFAPNIKLPDYSHLSGMIQHQSRQPVVQNFNITMPNVTNNTSAERIMRDLQRLPLDAYQYSRKR